MSELDKLQRLGLISKVCAELDNHLGFSDKTLAEYIIHLASQHKNNAKSFHKDLHDNGAEFPESFTENLLRIIMRLTGQAVTAKAKESVSVAPSVPRSEAEVKYPGLARQNTVPVPLEGMATEDLTSIVKEKPKPLPSRDSDRRDREEKEKNEKERRGRSRSDSRDRNKSSASSRDKRSHDDYDRRDDRRRDRSGSRGRDQKRISRHDDRDRDRRRDGDRGDRDGGRDRDGDRRGRDSRDDRDSDRNSKKPKSTPSEPEIYGIYDGKVSNILDFGCFVELEGFNRKEGLVHIAQIQQGMVRDAKQVVKKGQKCKVKIISMVGSKMALSMKEVDQVTGEDLLPQRSRDTIANLNTDLSNPARPVGQNYGVGSLNNGVDMKKLREDADDDEKNTRKTRKQLSSPELWEARQLINAGVLHPSEYPTYDAESGMGMIQSFEIEEEVEVEINEDEPTFLKGQTKMSRELSPVRIVKNPDGSMQRYRHVYVCIYILYLNIFTNIHENLHM